MNHRFQDHNEIGKRAQQLDTQYSMKQRMKLQSSSIKKLFGATLVYSAVIGIFVLIL
jgi:hypothetical protein